MLNLANGRPAEYRRIQYALLASLLLHLALLWKFGMLPTGFPTTHTGVLQVSLNSSAARFVAPDAPRVEAVADGMPSPQEARTPTAEPRQVTAPLASRLATNTRPATPDAASPPSSAAQDAPTRAVGLPSAGPTGAARRVEIEFEVYVGMDRQPAGNGRHIYTSDSDTSFGVSIRQASRLGEKAQESSWQLEISGRVDRHGLSPLLFQLQGLVPERLLALKGTADNDGRSRAGRMPDGILDRQSLLYQFMLVPPSIDGGKIWLSDGTTYGQYAYRIAGYESLSIPSLGSIQTMKLVFSTTDGPEIIELWLIPDRRYLPAKMRHTDRKGLVTEQVVVSLDSR